MILKIDTKPLSVNTAWKGRRFKTKEYKDFERELLSLLAGQKKIAQGAIELRIRFHMKNHKSSDWDNPIKTLQDVLVKSGVISDDKNVYIGMAQKVPSKTDYIEVMILPYVERNIFDT